MIDRSEEHLARLADFSTARLLGERGFDWGSADVHACVALRWRQDAGGGPRIIGLLGGASSGKSTLFNSLLEREISRISAHAHETLGPIAAVDAAEADRIRSGIRAGRLFAGYAVVDISDAVPTVGTTGQFQLHASTTQSLRATLLVDLPDMTSKMSADEGAVAHCLLPYFDGLIVVLDEERWFDAAVFDEIVEWSRNFGPRVWLVFNRTEQGGALTDEHRARLAQQSQTHHADDHCVSPFEPGCGYRPVSADTRSTLAGWMASADGRGRTAALTGYLQRRAAGVLHENVVRSEAFAELRRAVDGELAQMVADARLSIDLLTPEERGLLGLGRRFLPLYDVLRSIRQRFGWLSGKGGRDQIDFDKRGQQLAEVLTRNLELRFRHATDRIDEITGDSAYFDAAAPFANTWRLPEFDAAEWSHRIRAHIDAWKEETSKTARRSDMAALSVGMPLLLADLLFLGGAGMTATWTVAWVAALFGGKGFTHWVQRSPAYANYQTTVRSYQSLIREALSEQWQQNLAAMPQRHLKMTDPVLESLMYCSVPGKR